MIGVSGGYGSVLFTWLIHTVSAWSVEPLLSTSLPAGRWLLWICPALGLLVVAWFTRKFAPEAQGHGVPEVIAASHAGMDVLGISAISNMAAGILDQPLNHAEVMEAGRQRTVQRPVPQHARGGQGRRLHRLWV